jgi:hypothetical protein
MRQMFGAFAVHTLQPLFNAMERLTVDLKVVHLCVASPASCTLWTTMN